MFGAYTQYERLGWNRTGQEREKGTRHVKVKAWSEARGEAKEIFRVAKWDKMKWKKNDQNTEKKKQAKNELHNSARSLVQLSSVHCSSENVKKNSVGIR